MENLCEIRENICCFLIDECDNNYCHRKSYHITFPFSIYNHYPYKVYGDNTLLVLNGTSLNNDSALLALNWRYVLLLPFSSIIVIIIRVVVVIITFTAIIWLISSIFLFLLLPSHKISCLVVLSENWSHLNNFSMVCLPFLFITYSRFKDL